MRGWLQRLWGAPNVAEPSRRIDAQPTSLPSIDPVLLAELNERIEAKDLPCSETLLRQLQDSAAHHPVLRLRQASCLRLRGDLDQARRCCDQLLAEDGDAIDIQLELARCCLAERDLTAAVEHLDVALSLAPENGTVARLMGDVLLRLDRPQDAIEPLRMAVTTAADRDRAKTWFLLGEALRLVRDYEGAIAAQDECLRLDPHHVACHIARGHLFVMLEDDHRALASYQAAMATGLQMPVGLQLNIGSIHQNLGELAQARSVFERLVAERPGDHATRWQLCNLDLLECRWPEAWAQYRARFGAGVLPYRPMPYRPWDGRQLSDQTLLVLADEGLGDEIMFASCLPDLARRVDQVIVECEPRLLGLFRRSFPGLHLVATQRENTTHWLDGLPEPTWQVCAGDLPGFFRQQDSDFPSHTGYLQADPARVAAWRERLRQHFGDRRVIGMSWRGGIVGTRTKARSIDPQAWGPILKTPDVVFVNLQYGAYQSERASLQELHGVAIHDFPEALSDYDETAALVCALDLVVTCCTAIVHLSGALGRPVWVLTPLSPGWRYTADRMQMPWYPSSRIFRQPVYADWTGACHELSLALQGLTKTVTQSAA